MSIRYRTPVDAGGFAVTNLPAPVAASDAATKAYVDSASGGNLPVFNVKSYGAAGDGVANDLTAITNAINAAHNAGGGDVFFPKGTYLCTAQGAAFPASRDNVRLVGQSNASSAATPAVVIRNNGSTSAGVVFQAPSWRGGEIRNIRFESNVFAATTTKLLDLNGWQDGALTNCQFVNYQAAANDFGAVDLTNAVRVVVDHCRFDNLYYGLLGATSTSVTVRDSLFVGCFMGVFEPATAWTITNSTFQDFNTGYGIAGNSVVTALTVSGCRFVSTTAYNACVNLSANGMTLTNNYFSCTGSFGYAAVRLPGQSSGLNISGNNFMNGPAFDFNNNSNFGAITGNQFAGSFTRYVNHQVTGPPAMMMQDDWNPIAVGTHPVSNRSTPRWHPLIGGPTDTATGLALVNNRAYAVPFWPGRRCAISGFALELVTAATAGTIRVGVFDADSFGMPASPIVDCGTQPATAAGAVTGWGTAAGINAKLCFVVITGQGLTGAPVLRAATGRSLLIGDANAPGTTWAPVNAYYNDGTYTGAYGVAGFTLTGVTQAPAVAVKIG